MPTAHHEHIFEALKTAVKHGQLVVLSGIVGCGKTTLLRRIQDDLRRENDHPRGQIRGVSQRPGDDPDAGHRLVP